MGELWVLTFWNSCSLSLTCGLYNILWWLGCLFGSAPTSLGFPENGSASKPVWGLGLVTRPLEHSHRVPEFARVWQEIMLRIRQNDVRWSEVRFVMSMME